MSKRNSINDDELICGDCTKCNNQINAKELFTCDACSSCYHKRKECSGLSAAVFKACAGVGQVILVCNDCKCIDVKSLLKRVNDLERRLDNVESKTKDTDLVHDAVFAAVTEMQDIESRKNNVVLFGVPECDYENSEEKATMDLNKIKIVFKHTGVRDTKIKAAFRLGKSSGKARPLKVILGDQEDRNDLITQSRNLRRFDDEWYGSVFIRPDLTRRQQEFQKTLRAELEMRRKNGENVYIRGDKIYTRRSR